MKIFHISIDANLLSQCVYLAMGILGEERMDGNLIPTSTGDGAIGFFTGKKSDFIAKFQCDSTRCHWKKIRSDIKVFPGAVRMYLPAQYSC